MARIPNVGYHYSSYPIIQDSWPYPFLVVVVRGKECGNTDHQRVMKKEARKPGI